MQDEIRFAQHRLEVVGRFFQPVDLLGAGVVMDIWMPECLEDRMTFEFYERLI